MSARTFGPKEVVGLVAGGGVLLRMIVRYGATDGSSLSIVKVVGAWCGFAALLTVFAVVAVLLHEVGHVLVATGLGNRVLQIDLGRFTVDLDASTGGLIRRNPRSRGATCSRYQVDEESMLAVDSSKRSARAAMVWLGGPMVNLALAAASWSAAGVWSVSVLVAGCVDGHASKQALQICCLTNLIIALVELLPVSTPGGLRTDGHDLVALAGGGLDKQELAVRLAATHGCAVEPAGGRGEGRHASSVQPGDLAPPVPGASPLMFPPAAQAESGGPPPAWSPPVGPSTFLGAQPPAAGPSAFPPAAPFPGSGSSFGAPVPVPPALPPTEPLPTSPVAPAPHAFGAPSGAAPIVPGPPAPGAQAAPVPAASTATVSGSTHIPLPPLTTPEGGWIVHIMAMLGSGRPAQAVAAARAAYPTSSARDRPVLDYLFAKAALAIGDQALLPEVDEATERIVQNAPGEASYRQVRYLALVALGRLDEAERYRPTP